MKPTLTISKFSFSRLFGACAMAIAIAQAVVFGCSVNGVHLSQRFTSLVGVLTTAIAWLSRTPFAKKLGLALSENSDSIGEK